MSLNTGPLPLLDKLMSYWKDNPVVFHMPGHKLGRAFYPKHRSAHCVDADEILSMAALLDVTEIQGTDNLHDPKDVILQAMQLAAKTFNSKRTFFLVNGSTVGIHAMLAATMKKGDKLLVTRDCHWSILTGIMRVGCKPVFISVEYDEKTGVPLSITSDKIEDALKMHHDIKAILVTRPNYYGVCCDLSKIAEIAKCRNIYLLVDEAHGAHFEFAKDILPISAMSAGADICVQSAHKTLPAFTQGAYLHVNREDLSSKIASCLRCIETSSPSYIIMASLDYARGYMQYNGEKALSMIKEIVVNFKTELEMTTEFTVFDSAGGFEKDVTRLVVNADNINLSTREIAEALKKKKIIPEMIDDRNIVFIITCADNKETLYALLKAFQSIKAKGNKAKRVSDIVFKQIEEVDLISYEDYIHLDKKTVKLDDSIGLIAGDFIVAYPPGIPMLFPNQIITQQIVNKIKILNEFQISVYGANEGDIVVLNTDV